ncbi:MAG: PLDc_N domain-containing protein [Chloroflexi bacterium]|nr:PLDc_N domain-containing protein [Chloroflexota bacterium]MCI0818096.1 PLDc_N domain-containing protein [Chloroflexota bacterium]MCI0839668.1 PLDc_N domain-containing protein [Chloroflexota bacterium]MCI0886091.1 PLDc_N domain-containing protein [Chloroflexota bacterium]
MVDAVFLSTFWNVIGAAFLIMFVFVPLILLWTFALVDLFVRRDIQWKKVLWLLFIVFLPIFGPLIYLLVRPEEANVPYEEGARDA